MAAEFLWLCPKLSDWVRTANGLNTPGSQHTLPGCFSLHSPSLPFLFSLYLCICFPVCVCVCVFVWWSKTEILWADNCHALRQAPTDTPLPPSVFVCSWVYLCVCYLGTSVKQPPPPPLVPITQWECKPQWKRCPCLASFSGKFFFFLFVACLGAVVGYWISPINQKNKTTHTHSHTCTQMYILRPLAPPCCPREASK